jgi:FtsP/CotA-like multicopper oxidase with cupredoxin domain
VFPGPLIRLTEGKSCIVEIQNKTDAPEQVHWHGQFLDPDVDGADEEGTPPIPAGCSRRLVFTPAPSGFRFYHTHTMAGTDLARGLYSGLAGPVYIEPRNEPGDFDREVFLTLKEFAPYFNQTEMRTGFLAPKNPVRALYNVDQAAVARARAAGREPGWQIGYQFYSINGRMLGQGEPIRVRAGMRLLVHVLNASATELHSLALPGHEFKVLALDGNPVSTPAKVSVLWLAPGERISALIEMASPGVWILGGLEEHARMHGMGIVVEYEGETGPSKWQDPPRSFWDYRLFSANGVDGPEPDESIELTFTTEYSARDGFDTFAVNGKSFSMEKPDPIAQLTFGRRYRLKMRNATDDIHPIHLHRNSFEVTSIAGKPTRGPIKDVVMIGGYEEMTIDFTANRFGLSLFHCHMQDHMDAGFMALFDCK